MKKEERNDFRVNFPHIEKPTLIMSENGFDVLDISKRAIRFSLGTTLRGTMTFQNGESLNIEGVIFKIQDNEIVVQLSKDMPSERIYKEHFIDKKGPRT